MYRYETHLHTSPVSTCARTSARESVEFDRPIGSEEEFLTSLAAGKGRLFSEPNPKQKEKTEKGM